MITPTHGPGGDPSSAGSGAHAEDGRAAAPGRRGPRRTGLVAVVAAVALSGCWLQPGADPHRSGHNGDERVLTDANAATLHEAWSVDLGGSAVQAPVVSSGATHAVAGNVVHSRRLDDGGGRWSAVVAPTSGPGGPSDIGAPSMRGDDVFVPVFVPWWEPAIGIHRFDAATGAEGAPASPLGPSGSVTVSGSTLVGTFWRHPTALDWYSGLEVTDLDDASRSWSITHDIRDSAAGLAPITTPSVGAERILYGSGGTVYAYGRTRPTDCVGGSAFCRPVWSRSLGGTTTVPVLSDDEQTVYVGTAAGQVWALDATDGDVRWRAALGGAPTPQIVATPTVGDGRLYVTSTDGRVLAFDAEGCGEATCTAAWEATTGSAITTQSALAGGVLYVGSDAGTVHAFGATGCGATTCPALWDTSTGSRITGAPAVADGTLLVGTTDGRLIAYRPT